MIAVVESKSKRKKLYCMRKTVAMDVFSQIRDPRLLWMSKRETYRVN